MRAVPGTSIAALPSRQGAAVVLVAFALAGAAWGQSPGSAHGGAPAATSNTVLVAVADNLDWKALTPAQRAVLSPLQREWSSIEPSRRAKWLEIANRFPTLAPAERQRIHARMAEWASLSPAQRGLARQQFQQSRQFSDRQLHWDAYQALPEQTRKELAQRSRPVPARGNAVEAKGTAGAPGSANRRTDANAGKAQPAKAVTPTVVQAKPGATTTLLTRPAAPPLHQQPGLPKIAATPGFVDPSTLLPNRGPQGAAVRSAPAPRPGSKP
jgi:hypothetical protein